MTLITAAVAIASFAAGALLMALLQYHRLKLGEPIEFDWIPKTEPMTKPARKLEPVTVSPFAPKPKAAPPDEPPRPPQPPAAVHWPEPPKATGPLTSERLPEIGWH